MIYKIKKVLINAIYFLVVFFLALSISMLALTRKMNNYKTTQKPLVLSIDKDNIVISNSAAGRVEKVFVVTGQHVRKGDEIMQLANDTLSRKISSLEKLADENLSAFTELQLLKAQMYEYKIRAPKDGVIYHIHAAEGSYLNTSSPIVTMFADDGVKIVGLVNDSEYAKIQKNRELDVFSPRFKQIYKIIFVGIGRVHPASRYEDSKYEVQFKFVDPNEGAAFIEGEGLEVIAKSSDNEAQRPSARVAKFWNSFIIEK